MKSSCDVIIIGAGSVGVPTAFFLSLEGLKVLVIDELASVGQGQNKAAIGGVRATHSDPAKIKICLQSLSIFRSWTETYGQEIGWKKGGYAFPVYRPQEEASLKAILPLQKSMGLSINWESPDRMKEIVPGLNPCDLRGGTYSPDDAQISPLLALDAFYTEAKKRGVTFVFNEKVTAIDTSQGKIGAVTTTKNSYEAPTVLLAPGSHAQEVGRLAGLNLPVIPDSHEAGISAPLEQFLGPLVVDLRPGNDGKTSNFYFAQNNEGQVIFCYTPAPLFPGTNREPTSEFLPVLAARMIDLIPRLKNMLVRRTWRGMYPMTPDGLPICDKIKEVEGLYVAAGLCGQGFMMGPGLGRNFAALITKGKPEINSDLFGSYSYYRDFGKKTEALK